MKIMKAFSITTFIVFLLLQLCYAQTAAKAIVFKVSWENGEYEISDVRVVLGKAPEAWYKGEYLIKLKSADGKTLYQTTVRKLDIKLEPSEIPNIDELYITKDDENLLALDYDSLIGAKRGMMILMVPYIENARYLRFQHGMAVLAEYDLSKLCNNDGVCDVTENYLSCESDCKPNKKDGYCLHLKDSVCDPDCAEGIDPDCAGKKRAENDRLQPKLVEGKLLYFFIAFIILVSVVYILKKKRDKNG